MLSKVTEHPYEMPLCFSPALALLLTEVCRVCIFFLFLDWRQAQLFSHFHTTLTLSSCSLVQLLCKTPKCRLRSLDCYVSQRFFNGISFDSQTLMKFPIQTILELKDHPNRKEKSARGLTLFQLQDFECDLFDSLSSNLSSAIPHQHWRDHRFHSCIWCNILKNF